MASLNAVLLLACRSIHKKSENVSLFSGPQDLGRVRNLWMRLFFFTIILEVTNDNFVAKVSIHPA